MSAEDLVSEQAIVTRTPFERLVNAARTIGDVSILGFFGASYMVTKVFVSLEDKYFALHLNETPQHVSTPTIQGE